MDSSKIHDYYTDYMLTHKDLRYRLAEYILLTHSPTSDKDFENLSDIVKLVKKTGDIFEAFAVDVLKDSIKER